MQNLLFIAAGGALGASTRYGIGVAAARILGTAFPFGTLIVNLAGCFAMGIVGQWLLNLEGQTTAAQLQPAQLTPELGQVAARAHLLRHVVAIGFLGGLTTFSSFGWETLREMESGRLSLALLNVAANVCLSLLAVWAGASLVRTLS